MKPNFFDYTLSDLKTFFTEKNEKSFRATQLFKWVYQKQTLSPELMTDLSKDFRQSVLDLIDIELPKVVDHRISVDGTQKFLFDVGDGLTVETVMIPTDSRKTLCVSSEVGCNLGCKFCYTGKEKLKKRLTAGQIVGPLISRSAAADWMAVRISCMPKTSVLLNSKEDNSMLLVCSGINGSRVRWSTELGCILTGCSASAVAEAITATPIIPSRTKAKMTPRQEAKVNLKNCPIVSMFSKLSSYFICSKFRGSK